jgi:hypothetical protein
VHIARQTPQELVVVTGTRWVAAISAASALLTLYFVITRHELKGLFLAAFFLLFVLILDSRKTFKFDAMRRIVRWNGRTAFKGESGEILYDDITDIGTQSTRAGDRGILIYRLTIVTSQATIPMAYTYSGNSDAYSTLRGQILDFIKSGSTSPRAHRPEPSDV